jgi:hypothetical protein
LLLCQFECLLVLLVGLRARWDLLLRNSNPVFAGNYLLGLLQFWILLGQQCLHGLFDWLLDLYIELCELVLRLLLWVFLG